MNMRAKMKVINTVKHSETHEEIELSAVCKNDGPYPPDGSDENNTFAKWTPSASLKMSITNPVLIGNFYPGQEFYVDFSPVGA